MWSCDGRVTVLSVIPGIRGLRHKLSSSKSNYCKPLINALQSAINKRLSKYESHPLYITGAVLDPRFKLQWCSQDEFEQVKSTVVSLMQEYAAMHTESTDAQREPSTNLASSSSVVQPTTSQEPMAKKAKLFSFMDHDDAFDMHQELMDFCKAKLLDYDSDP